MAVKQRSVNAEVPPRLPPFPLSKILTCILNTAPYTLHYTPYTLHTTLYTLHPSPHTLHPAFDRGTSLTRKRISLRPYLRPTPRVLEGS